MDKEKVVTKMRNKLLDHVFDEVKPKLLKKKHIRNLEDYTFEELLEDVLKPPHHGLSLCVGTGSVYPLKGQDNQEED